VLQIKNCKNKKIIYYVKHIHFNIFKMEKHLYTFIKKIPLTDDVYELTFIWPKDTPLIPGQFLTFFIDNVWAKMYSILQKNWNKYSFIIKEIDIKNGWQGGSTALCNLEAWDIIPAIGPVWKFTLQTNTKPKLFCGTGTGFVPLWNQITSLLGVDSQTNIKLIFWVREKKDIFYYQELSELSKKHINFSFEYYVSREEITDYKYGRITQFIQELKNIDSFEEFYICGNPKMVDEIALLLEQSGKSNIYFEKY
jgi:Na+-transporting NADH:ubiquinone oxidoreductase subunit F